MRNILMLIIIVLCFGIAGHIDQQDRKFQQAIYNCQEQTDYTTPTHAQCMANQYENNNDR